MARTVYYVAASQDGFVAEARDPGGWLREFEGAREAGASFRGLLAAAGALAMGAETYRVFVAEPESWPCGNTPVWVFTHHEFPGISGADITFVRGDVAEFHPDIIHDAGDRDVLLVGGGNLAGQFMDSGLVDEMVVTVLPLSLGSGRPILPVLQSTDPAGVEERSLGHAVVQRQYDLRG
ncbi:dihydrofolate reductase family protein [Arthrobacter gengyunqii]|uniref:Dihydrofolate reductase family protein n=1 Tax=Arthrobacter gengyunqii TaxID=2886940 RepID=A0A9X1M0Y8_9MICC|nr:dihydrofolate reductase family protein [Arthrobacter gengyunqii]MCC3265046.1 dihydrofolate reductase family protein [Arthrobacter gengyunqii]MCC3269259.1 dihydrofolate reductase family protein [Arthrobacter gengyunqii]UOY94787.1 dihydrofolate reductase family protein [Arthrobacter gengyunqii]